MDLNSPILMPLFAAADMVLSLSFLGLAAAVLLYVHRKQPDNPLPAQVVAGVMLWFACLYCGELLSFWFPLALGVGAMKAVTAMGLLIVSIAVFPMMPTLVERLTPAQYEGVLQQVWSANDNMKAQIKDQNVQVQHMAAELSGRVRNILATIHGMAKETAHGTSDIKVFLSKFNSRLVGLTHCYDLLLANQWRGAPLREVVHAQLETFPELRHVQVSGPEVFLKPMAVQQLSMALCELAANSVPNGAGQSSGCHVSWYTQQDERNTANNTLRFSWHENQPHVLAENYEGFGHAILNYVTPTALNGISELKFRDEGMLWELEAPIADLCNIAA